MKKNCPAIILGALKDKKDYFTQPKTFSCLDMIYF